MGSYSRDLLEVHHTHLSFARLKTHCSAKLFASAGVTDQQTRHLVSGYAVTRILQNTNIHTHKHTTEMSTTTLFDFTTPPSSFSNSEFMHPISSDDEPVLESEQSVGEGSLRELLMEAGEVETKRTMSLDLNTLLRVLDEHNTNKDGEEHSYSTWQLVVIQGLLLTILVLVSITWACCCRRRCLNAAPNRVQDALRKLSVQSTKSKDFPPSYSTADLHTLAMSVHDYLYPPPQYPDITSRRSCDDLAYLDLEAGHQRMSRLSFSSGSGNVPLLNNNGSTVIQPAALSWQPSSVSLTSESSRSSQDESGCEGSPALSTSSRKNSIMKDTSSRKSSLSQDSRRSSRVSFSEAVECSNGSYRRLSGSQEYLARLAETHDHLFRQSSSSSLSSSDHSSSPSRRSSSSDSSRRSSADLSRKSSSNDLSRRSSSNDLLLRRNSSSQSLLLSRKLGLSQEALDKELRKKLENLEKEEQEMLAEEERRAAEAETQRIEKEMRRNEIESISPAAPLETIVEVERH